MRKKQLRKPDVLQATATTADAASVQEAQGAAGADEAAVTTRTTGVTGTTSATPSPDPNTPDLTSPTGATPLSDPAHPASAAASSESESAPASQAASASGNAPSAGATSPGDIAPPPAASAGAGGDGGGGAPPPAGGGVPESPDDPSGTPASEGSPVAAGRKRSRVRNRLLGSVLLCAVAVIAAGTPAVVAASRDATDAQELVSLARLNQQAIALSHSLADERDGMVEYVAAGRTSKGGAGVSETQRARVDRQAREIRAASSPSYVRKTLKKLPGARQQAMTGHGGAFDVYESYTDVIKALRGVTQQVANDLPARAQDPTAAALPGLARAIDQASATRGLLRGAFAGQGTQRELTAQAQQARVREEAALADFDETAGAKARDSYSTTVNGTDVNVAERYLERVTARPYLTPSVRAMDQDRFDTSLSARIAHMRGVQSSFAAEEIKRLEGLRDDDVTALQLRGALLGVCVLLALGVSVSTARSLTRPLSVLRRGSRRLAGDPAGEEPIAYKGRNDEFADVVNALNSLRTTAVGLRRRVAGAESEQDQLAVEKAELTERHQLLGDDYAALLAELEEAREELIAALDAPQGTFINLAMRAQGLVERQLGVIEELEEKETDPDRLAALFKLDHLATRMRRHSENLLLLAGAEHSGSHQQGPVALLDVVRAAISEIERYERVELGSLPPHTQISSFAADDLSHLIAELLDNAAAFSAPGSEVRLSGWRLENGEVMLSVQDDGIGMSDERLAGLNARLSEPEAQRSPFAPDGSATEADEPNGLGLGLYVVAKLTARHRLRVQLRKQKQGGLAAVVIVPRTILPDRPVPAAAPAEGTKRAGTTRLPGSMAEANSNALPGARRRHAAPPVDAEGDQRREGARTRESDPAPQPHEGREFHEGRDGHGAREGDGGHGAREGREEREGLSSATGAGAFGPVGAGHAPKAETEIETEHAPEAGTGAGAGSESGAGTGNEPRGEVGSPGADAGDKPVGERSRAEGEQVKAADEHARAEDRAPVQDAGQRSVQDSVHAPAPTAGASDERDGVPPVVTDKGLPKRTPRVTAPEAAAPRQRKAGPNAEELRRRLGGFQQGAREGLREAAAQVAAGTGPEAGAQADSHAALEADAETDAAGPGTEGRARTQVDGGTAEEARK
ncbi:sensor histidine kinase [Streptomyces axinellae]|uniref:histidine kinase n=1 Tax=Streptomyces axinellae TaxID=552788 RepID=A0ABP6C8Q6_9ACTN